MVVPLRAWHVIKAVDLAPLIDLHDEMRALCRRLEDMADQLPVWPDPARACDTAGWLTGRRREHRRTESALLRDLFARDRRPLAASLLDLAAGQEDADSLHAEDLAEALTRPAGAVHADTLAYMLRCFFDGCRRKLLIDELSLLALAGQRLSVDARELLEASIARALPTA